MDEQQTFPVIQDERPRIEGLDEALKEWKELEDAVVRAKAKFDNLKGHVAMLLRENARKKYVGLVGNKERWFELKGGEEKVHYGEADPLKPKRASAPRTTPVRAPAAKPWTLGDSARVTAGRKTSKKSTKLKPPKKSKSIKGKKR